MGENYDLRQKEYLDILAAYPELQSTAKALASSGTGISDSIAAVVIAPVIFMYASHILARAAEYGIKRLYFLARDGYPVMKAAQCIAKKQGADIRMSYFYCSRHSLRMAAYKFFDDSAYDRLFYECYDLSAVNFFSRAEFTYEERCAVCDDISFDINNEKQPMSREEFSQFCNNIKASQIFTDILKRKSENAYADTIGYIRQEGMAECGHIGIVDLGWTGSMQHTLKRLLTAEGITAPVTGFYMGMLEPPPIDKDSRFDCFLFEGHRDSFTKAWFAHNLMECICTAPHGMTAGYEQTDKGFVPLLCDNENNAKDIEHFSDIIAAFAEKVKSSGAYDRNTALKLLKKLMLTPSAAEAGAFGGHRFCDDVGENYYNSIVRSADKEELSCRLIHYRILNKLRRKKLPAGNLYWYYGSLALSSVKAKGYYRNSCRLYEGLRYFILGTVKRR